MRKPTEREKDIAKSFVDAIYMSVKEQRWDDLQWHSEHLLADYREEIGFYFKTRNRRPCECNSKGCHICQDNVCGDEVYKYGEKETLESSSSSVCKTRSSDPCVETRAEEINWR